MVRPLSSDARSALHEGRQAYVAIEASSGPHITPELYAYSDDQVWFATAVSTVKAKVLLRTRTCAMAVAVPGRTVLLHGPVECFDLRNPRALLAQVGPTPAAARGTAHATGDSSQLKVEFDRVVKWDGVTTSTRRLRNSSPARSVVGPTR